jgi:hypothetical protein
MQATHHEPRPELPFTGRANRPCERDERLAWGHCDRARCLTRARGRELTVSRRIVNDREAFVDPTTELIR